MSLSYVTSLSLLRLFCPGFVHVTYYRVLQSETKGPHHIHSLRSSCSIKKSAFNVAENLVTVREFTFQSAFGNSRQNPDTPAREVVRSHSSCILSYDLIGQHQNKRFYVTEIVWPLGFADVIFRRERSDDRKYVCCSQARGGHIRKQVYLFSRLRLYS